MAFVGELDAPKIPHGMENFDAQIAEAVVFRLAYANDAEFPGLLREAVQHFDTRAKGG